MKTLWLVLALIALAGFGFAAARGQGTGFGRSGSVVQAASSNPVLSLPTGDVLHFISPTGSDSNDGTSAATAWATPNHALNCGDVIIAAAGRYSGNGFPTFGGISNCPSTTGGIDGAGGINFAVLLCGGADITSCAIFYTGGIFAIDVAANNWAVEGFQVAGNGGKGAFAADGSAATVNHIAFINDVAFNVGIGFGALDNGMDHDVPGATGFDYVAYVGDIAENAELNTVCTAAMPMAGPATINSDPGTHFLWYGNFAWNQGNNGCGSDIENFMMDTPDAHGMTNQVVMQNNVGWSAWRFGIQFFVQNNNPVTGLTEIAANNTLVNNTLSNAGGLADLNIQVNSSTAPTIEIIKNISLSTQSAGCAALVGGQDGPSSLVNVNTGTSGNENVFFNDNGGSNTCAFNGYRFSSNNFLSNPSFTNLSDLLTNRTAAPSCAGFVNVTQCMGYASSTSTLTTPSVISDLVPTGANTSGRGYQLPSVTCAANALYPTWLKGVVYLHWNSSTSTITENADLVTKPCGL